MEIVTRLMHNVQCYNFITKLVNLINLTLLYYFIVIDISLNQTWSLWIHTFIRFKKINNLLS